jgi:hypothetical protein
VSAEELSYLLLLPPADMLVQMCPFPGRGEPLSEPAAASNVAAWITLASTSELD